jgi:hypothetical protein
MITDKRAMIDVEKIDPLLFLKKNLHIWKNIFDRDQNEKDINE